MQDFLADEPGTHRHNNGIRLWREIPTSECHRDVDWDPPTMKQVIRTWFEDEELRDITTHGMSVGWSHFTYYFKQTSEFYDRFEDQVFQVID